MLRIALSLFVVLSLGFVTACTTTEAYEKQLNTWIGKSDKELVLAWGVPDKQYQLDANTKMLSYISHQTVVYPGEVEPCVAAVNRNGMLTSCPPQIPPTAETYHCETIFTIQNGHVVRWGHKGNNCRA